MANKNLIAERLKAMNESKDELKQDNKPNIVQNIATGKEEKPDFEKMAEVLEAQKEEKVSENSEYTKDTIYIRNDLFKAMNALCVRQGDKKRLVNQMYEEFLTKKYKELHKDLVIDK